MATGKLYLIPSAIAEATNDHIVTFQLEGVLRSTKFFIAEHAREARRFISSLKLGIKIEALQFEELNKHEPTKGIRKMLDPAVQGEHIGLMSDAGCPGVADPGAEVVKEAHRLGIEVIPLVGSSSILLGLMGSGLSGQNFRFNGYLPIDGKTLKNKLIELEAHSRRFNETQLFIETPYRSDKMLNQLVNTLSSTTELCIACDLLGKNQKIITHLVSKWRSTKLEIGKNPTVFLFLA